MSRIVPPLCALALGAVATFIMTPASAEEAHTAHATHWSYEGEGAPAHWGDLKPEFIACKTGTHQSPIDINSKTAPKPGDIAFSYSGIATDIVNNGHTLQVNFAQGSTITVNGKLYTLLQFHFHSPSEHTVDGKPADMVVHLVHKSDDGQLGVIGVLMDAGKNNKVLASLWARMPKHEGETVELHNMKVDLMALLPKNTSYYNYTGSLTTPPCSEGVNWMVMSHRVTVSKEQIDAFTRLFPHSTRPVQALNDRTINGK